MEDSNIGGLDPLIEFVDRIMEDAEWLCSLTAGAEYPKEGVCFDEF